jgi:hypothetical protein
MAKWGARMQEVGSVLADVGTPFGPGRSVWAMDRSRPRPH